MKNVCALSLVLLSLACGQANTSAGTGSTSPTSKYLAANDPSVQRFHMNLATGALTLVQSNGNMALSMTQITIGPWIYVLNAGTNSIDVYNTNNTNVIVQSTPVANTVTSIAAQ